MHYRLVPGPEARSVQLFVRILVALHAAVYRHPLSADEFSLCLVCWECLLWVGIVFCHTVTGICWLLRGRSSLHSCGAFTFPVQSIGGPRTTEDGVGPPGFYRICLSFQVVKCMRTKILLASSSQQPQNWHWCPCSILGTDIACLLTQIFHSLDARLPISWAFVEWKAFCLTFSPAVLLHSFPLLYILRTTSPGQGRTTLLSGVLVFFCAGCLLLSTWNTPGEAKGLPTSNQPVGISVGNCLHYWLVSEGPALCGEPSPGGWAWAV